MQRCDALSLIHDVRRDIILAQRCGALSHCSATSGVRRPAERSGCEAIAHDKCAAATAPARRAHRVAVTLQKEAKRLDALAAGHVSVPAMDQRAAGSRWQALPVRARRGVAVVDAPSAAFEARPPIARRGAGARP